MVTMVQDTQAQEEYFKIKSAVTKVTADFLCTETALNLLLYALFLPKSVLGVDLKAIFYYTIM